MEIDHTTDAVRPRWRKQLIPNIVDHLAEVEPDKLYAEYPISTASYDEGYRKITYAAFANAINGVAWWLQETLGPGRHSEALAYIGPNDLRYPALILGAIKAGYMIFLTSPRNSVAAQINLFERLKCKNMLCPSPHPQPVSAILAKHDLRVSEVPTVDELLNKHYSHFPYQKAFGEAFSQPLLAVHTSGSTGMPKPIIYTHGTGATNMEMNSLDPPPGVTSQDMMYQGKRVFLTFPPFHAAYIVMHLFNAIPFGTVNIAPTSSGIVSAQGLVEALRKTPADIAFLVPSIILELSQNPELLDYCAQNLEMIIYCGGDLPQSMGDAIATKIKLVNQFGATELGLSALLHSKNRDPADWKYVQFHPDLGAELRHVTEGTHELCIVRDPKKEVHQPTFSIFPSAQEYASRDLFLRHPSEDKADLWQWRARADDILVFLNGEKTNPISMEQHIVARNPEVAAVLVVGAQRFQAALLIEPVTDGKQLSPSKRAAFIEKIWPSIEEANKDCPTHARIAKTHILFTRAQEPMIRAGKGTVQRPGTLSKYESEIDALYADADKMLVETNGEVPGKSGSLESVHAVSLFTKETILSITNWQNLNDEDDFFALGMDSLQVLTAVRKLRHGFGLLTIATSSIYTNPSIFALSNAIFSLSKQHEIKQTSSAQGRYDARNAIFEEYQSMIDQMPTQSRTVKEGRSQNIILTGSTGALGSYILHTLLANPEIAHIYCLNRATDSFSLQIERNQSRGLPTKIDSTRVTFLKTDLSQPLLGLPSKTYNQLLETTTLVIHNAWPVNFNLSLPSFRPQLAGLVNLIEFTTKANTSSHLFFISSISSVMSYRTSSLQTPEKVIQDNAAPAPNGYAESKFLSERLLDYAARKLSINVSFARVGQICGAVNRVGMWNKAEWFPSLVISSLHVCALPDTFGPSLSNIDWVPIDLLAEVLVELAGSCEQPIQNGSTNGHAATEKSAQVFHPLNPHPTTWEAIRAIVIDELHALSQKPQRTIPLGKWIAAVRKDVECAAGSRNALQDGDLEALLQVNPAVKLLDFYDEVLGAKGEGGNKLEIRKTAGRSGKLRGLEAVKGEWVRKWVREWVEAKE